jgi:hypothetical protein
MVFNNSQDTTTTMSNGRLAGEANTSDWRLDSSGSPGLLGSATKPNNSAGHLQVVPVTNLPDVFRLEVSPEWVSQHWDRISSIESDDGLRGLRVAFASGINQSDVHGCLTYYFDNRTRLQRITFQGWTGDPSPIISLVTHEFGFKSQNSSIAGCYVARSWGKDIGVLLLKHPPVVRAELSQQQFAVALEVLNPSSKFELSNLTRQFLADATGR